MEEPVVEVVDEVNEPRSSLDRSDALGKAIKKWMIRFGGGTCVVGILITFIGMGQLAKGVGAYSLAPRIIHSCGLAVLLAGSVISLLALRVESIVTLFRKLTRAGQGPSTPPGAGHAWQQPQLPRRHAKLLSMVLVLVLFFPFSVIVVLGLPDGLAGLYLFATTILLVTIVVVVMLHGRPFQRTFSVGAIVPLGLAFFHLWVVGPFASPARFGGWSNYSASPPLFPQELIVIWNTLATANDAGGLQVCLLWLLALGCGLTAVGVRLALEYFNAAD